jgi:predicted nucleotidyltransferase
MSGNDAALAVIDALLALNVPYVLVGSFASNAYGIDRSTQDADFVIALGDSSLSELFRRLRPEIRFDPQMAFETVTMTRKHVADVVGSPFKIELFQLSDDPHDRDRFQRRREVELQGRRVFVLTAEDVIITKLRWGRAKDKEDVRDVIAVQGESRIDWDYVLSWTERHGTTGLLGEIRRSIPWIDRAPETPRSHNP